LDMVPAGLPFDEVGMEEKPAVIVQARDQMPFDPGIGRPLMLGRVVLDELSHIVGQDLPVMGLSFGLGQVIIVLLGPLDDRRNGDLLTILVPEPVPDITVVVGLERNLGGFDQAFFQLEFLEDVLFDLGGDLVRAVCPPISDREPTRIIPILSEDLEEAASPDPQDTQEVSQLDLPVIVSLEQSSNLLIAERFVQLFGHGITSLFIRMLNHSRTPQSTFNL
jgi:hypothetical protein